MKKYKTGGWSDILIEEIEIIRETEKCIFYLGWSDKTQERKSLKHSSSEQYWDTWHEAYDYLLEKERKAVDNAEDNLARRKENLLNIRNLLYKD